MGWGDVMRGLAGALQGYNEGMDYQQKWEQMLKDKARQAEQDKYNRDNQALLTTLAFHKEGYRPTGELTSAMQAAQAPTGPFGIPANLARVAEIAKSKAQGDIFTMPNGQTLQYDPEIDPKVQDQRRSELRIKAEEDKLRNVARDKALRAYSNLKLKDPKNPLLTLPFDANTDYESEVKYVNERNLASAKGGGWELNTTALGPHKRPMWINKNTRQAIEADEGISKAGSDKLRSLPASAVEKMGAYDALAAMTTDVQNALKDAISNKRDVTGRALGVIKTPPWWKNSAPVMLGGKPSYADTNGGDKGVDVRAMIGNLYGTLAKERGGTALSANEIRLLESYLPNENEDEGRAYLKAVRFGKELLRLKNAKLKAYQKYGFGVDDEAPMGDQPIPPNGGYNLPFDPSNPNQ